MRKFLFSYMNDTTFNTVLDSLLLIQRRLKNYINTDRKQFKKK